MSHPLPFFDTIVDIAHERVVTAADFEPFVGYSNWLSFDRAEPRGADCDEFCAGVVWGFELIGAYPIGGKVPIGYSRDYGLRPGMVMVRLNDTDMLAMDADELAIRIDAS